MDPTGSESGATRSEKPKIAGLYAAHAADVLVALGIGAFAEILIVGVVSWSRFSAPYELARSVVRLLPLAMAAALPLCLLGSPFVALVVRGSARGARLSLAGLFGVFGGVVAALVSTGRHFENLALRAVFVGVFFAAGAAFAYSLAPRIAKALSQARRLYVALATLGIAAALEIVNVLVLPRLYPGFHAGLSALTVACLMVLSLSFRRGGARGGERRSPALSSGRTVVIGLLALTAFVLAPKLAKRLSVADNLRLIYLDRGPLMGQVIRGAAALSPPPALTGEPLRVAESGHAIDLKGRDILLISVDALRADHSGAYGYERPTTPNIDALAKEGAVFEKAYTPTPHTSYAITSLMTGKYMRPLLLQGLGADSETWAAHLRRYEYKTAAFYPPAVFFIDGDRFAPFRDGFLGFEYRKVEFAGADKRARQVDAYLERAEKGDRLFMWVHLFEPHEPYVEHPELCDPQAELSAERCADHKGRAFGERDVDRYDAEIAAADAGIGRIVRAFRAARPNAIVIVTADHGEEFGEHGGRYHGTSVYEEQVRVPLVVSAPGLIEPRRIAQPVQLIDLLPTVLAGLDIPRPARVRGTDLGPLLAGKPPLAGFEDGFAFAETDEQTMLAKGPLRLVCARKVGACALYDLTRDPGERKDDPSAFGPARDALRAELTKIAASHGTFELSGLRAEGKGWPPALRRALAGDADAASDVAGLLDDADVVIRRKAAEVLFDLRRPETAAALRLAIVRDEDSEVRTRAALALTRLGEGASRTREVLGEADVPLRRLAALALAEQGETYGEAELIAWWRRAFPKDKKEREPLRESRARDILKAFARIKSKDAVYPLIVSLDDVRLRPYIAEALAEIGEDSARPALAEHLAVERYQTARVAIVKALLKLGAKDELARPLAKLLGMPDPLPNGLEYALEAGVLQYVGGPRYSDLNRLHRFSKAGAPMRLLVPKVEKFPQDRGLRAICRARSTDGAPGDVHLGRVKTFVKGRYTSWIPNTAPDLNPALSVVLRIEPRTDPNEMIEVWATLPPEVGLKQGELGEFVVYTTQNIEVAACAVVALQDELPPPPPEPWTPVPEEDAP